MMNRFREDPPAEVVLPEEQNIGEAGESSLGFDELYELYANDVLRLSYYYLGDRQRAEDVCQDVFVRLITNKPKLAAGHEKGWLLRVTVNRCRDLWRSSWLKRVVLGSPVFEIIPGPDEIGSMVEKQALAHAINKVPAVFREVLLLHYYQGMAINEIAEMLQVA